jgi:hypothetical protein
LYVRRKMPFLVTFLNFLLGFNIFQECISGLADFQGISGLAISGFENFEN